MRLSNLTLTTIRSPERIPYDLVDATPPWSVCARELSRLTDLPRSVRRGICRVRNVPRAARVTARALAWEGHEAFRLYLAARSLRY